MQENAHLHWFFSKWPIIRYLSLNTYNSVIKHSRKIKKYLIKEEKYYFLLIPKHKNVKKSYLVTLLWERVTYCLEKSALSASRIG